MVGNSVPIKDLEFVLIHVIYNLIVRYIKIQNKNLTLKNFNDALSNYINAIKSQLGVMYDLKHPRKDDE
ncbi:hypothetical protein DS832_07020 [Bombilactobacillus bombi]|uniref:Uncharacterized protein n=1 Tax=Bombilactobacillus bombi TaxID=1303590 RepID=A0A3R6Z8X3_9LACO|nr:hypothetical protein DS832_07020 [Bombilactobacillus bombi]